MRCFDNYIYYMVAKQVLKFLLTVLIFSSQALSQRLNIIMILSDDMGYADLGCYGSRDNHTPILIESPMKVFSLTRLILQVPCARQQELPC